MMIPIEEQVARYEANADQAIDLLVSFIQTNRDVIKRTQVRRMSSIGVDDYGDETWHKTPEACGVETIAELADASFYLSVPVEQIGFVATLQLLTGLNPEDVA